MLKSYKRVWSVCRTYNVEVGNHSTEAAAEADLQKVLGSANWADAQSTHLKAVEIAEKDAAHSNSLTIDEEVDRMMDEILNEAPDWRMLDTPVRSEISGYEVTPRDLLMEILHPNRPVSAGSYVPDFYTLTVVIDDSLPKPEVTSCWEITRWGRLRQKVAVRLGWLAGRVGVSDPDYNPYYDDDDLYY